MSIFLGEGVEHLFWGSDDIPPVCVMFKVDT